MYVRIYVSFLHCKMYMFIFVRRAQSVWFRHTEMDVLLRSVYSNRLDGHGSYHCMTYEILYFQSKPCNTYVAILYLKRRLKCINTAVLIITFVKLYLV